MKPSILPILMAGLLFCSGCSFLGVLFSSRENEKKTPPEFNLREHADKTLMVWIDHKRSSGVDADVPDKLADYIAGYLVQNVGLDAGKVLVGNEIAKEDRYLLRTLDPEDVARREKVDLLLYVRIDRFENMLIRTPNFYTGLMHSRSMLLDVATDETLWPEDKSGKKVEIEVDLETQGREAAVGRMCSGMGHCIVRYLFPCPTNGFKLKDEKIRVNEVIEDLI